MDKRVKCNRSIFKGTKASSYFLFGEIGNQNFDSTWCSRGDLNPHTVRHTHLKRTCLPFHHPSKKLYFLRRIYVPLSNVALHSFRLQISFSGVWLQCVASLCECLHFRTSTIPPPEQISVVHPVGFEPTTAGFEDRYSSN